MFNLLRKADKHIGMFFAGIISSYQKYVSPHLGTHCRFSPTCSDYAREAVWVKGLTKGLMLAIGRIARCNSFFPGGNDPVR